MRRDRSLRFDALETRQLLSKAHVAAHPAAAVVATPVVLTGTLAVNMKDASSIQNSDGSTTTTAAVSGRLGSFGKVVGIWSESMDSYGDYEGPDSIQLQSHNPKGTYIIEFNNDNTKPAARIGHDTGMYQHAQHLVDGKGAFAKVSETGSIEVLESNSKKTVESLVLITANPQT